MLINKKVEVTNTRLDLTKSWNSSVGDTSIKKEKKFDIYFLLFLPYYSYYSIHYTKNIYNQLRLREVANKIGNEKIQSMKLHNVFREYGTGYSTVTTRVGKIPGFL
jgi:hypothetical protein